MNVLIFDTTASACNIVLLKDEQIVSKYSQTMDFGQSEVLIPEIKTILDNNKITFSEIGAVFVCVGPGSFTGVRASISAAKVFGVARPEIIVSGFSAFDAYISLLDNENIAKCNAVIIETKRDDFYVSFYDHELKPLSEAQSLSREEIISFLKKQNCTITLIGDGVERFLNQPSGLQFSSIKMLNSITTEALSKIALKQLKQKKFNFPKPLYIRPADVSGHSI